MTRERPWRLGRARKLGLVGCCGGRSGPCAGLAERERNWAGRVEGEEGRELGQGNWVGLGFGFLDLGFLFFFYFISKTNTQILIEFKFQFEFKPSTQTKGTMHQHECNNKFLNLDKF